MNSVFAFEITKSGYLPIKTTAQTLDQLTGSLPVGYYTTFSTLSGGSRVLGLRAHLNRLYQPALIHDVQPAVSVQALRRNLAELAKLNLPAESRIRIILAKADGSMYAGIQSFSPLPNSVYENGVRVVTSAITRIDPRIKGTDFISRSQRERALVAGDVFEVLLTQGGRVLEGMTSNFYALRLEGDRPVLVTARRGILLGVTRRAVLRVAKNLDISIAYQAPRLEDDFSEAFLTSSSRGIVPIICINDHPVGEGRVGKWTKLLMQAHHVFVERNSEAIIPKIKTAHEAGG